MPSVDKSPVRVDLDNTSLARMRDGTKPDKPTIITQDLEHEINVPEFVWKVIVVLDRPGQGIADVIADTQIITVVSENDFLTQPDGTPVRSPDGTNAYLRWYEGAMDIISVRELENRLNNNTTNQERGIRYDFFSNIPQEIQDIIENRRFTWTGNNPIGAFPILTAPLLADTSFTSSQTNFESAIIVPDTPVWHDGVAEKSFSEANSFQVGSSQVSIAQIDTHQVSTFQVGSGQQGSSEYSFLQVSPYKNSFSQIGFDESSTFQISPSQISLSQIGSSEASMIKFSPSQVCSGQIGDPQLGKIQVSFIEDGAGEISTNKTSFSQADTCQISPSQISFIEKGIHSATTKVTSYLAPGNLNVNSLTKCQISQALNVL